MAIDDLEPLINADPGDVTIDFDTIEDTAGLLLDDDDHKIRLREWAKANGCSIKADIPARKVTFVKTP